MDTHDSEKDIIRDNYKQAVRYCQLLKIGSRQYKDGVHSFRMNYSIDFTNMNGDCFQNHCDLRYNAKIKGTNA